MKTLSKLLSKGLELSLFAFSFVAMSGCDGGDNVGGGGGDVSSRNTLEDFFQIGICVVACLLVTKQLLKMLNKRQATLS